MIDAAVRQPYLLGRGWIEVKDGDDTARAIFDGHYSRRRYKDKRAPLLFVGPGTKKVYVRPNAGAVWVWRKFIDDCVDPRSGEKQAGVNCAVFRNESDEVASDLIREAVALAADIWPGERLYTYVDPREVRATMVRGCPVWGWSFLRAGWTFAFVTKGGLIVYETVAS